MYDPISGDLFFALVDCFIIPVANLGKGLSAQQALERMLEMGLAHTEELDEVPAEPWERDSDWWKET